MYMNLPRFKSKFKIFLYLFKQLSNLVVIFTIKS